jgi:ATP-dependent DNA ligase
MFQLLNGKSADEITNCLRIIIEIEGQNWTKDYRIRHPRIVRYRPDRSDPNKVDFSQIARK